MPTFPDPPPLAPPGVIVDEDAQDVDLGLLRTGKEADVHLVERTLGDRACLLAVKRYRGAEHRMFHRDAGYVEGRTVRRSRENRAMAHRTSFGRELLAGQWAAAEFAALQRLWTEDGQDGVRVPYPVARQGTELVMEFIGEPDGTPAPRLSQLRPTGEELADLWRQVLEAMFALAGLGLTHGDLSPYNLLVHRGRLVVIDLPQVVDVVVNPQGPDYLARDVQVVCRWFTARGLTGDARNADRLTGLMLADAGLR